MSKINTKNLICCRVELETLDNISRAINALQLVETDEFYYNYELSETARYFKNYLKEILTEINNEITN